MSSKTLYPHTLTQSSESGTNFREFNNLKNVKNANNTYAKTGQIASKSGTHKRPSTITAKNFKASIPAGSRINKITVEYAADYEGNVSIRKPTIDILNISGDDKKGKALTKTMSKSSATWNGDHTIANVNSSDFGVKINFPANTKADTGYVKVKYIRIIIDYTVPNFSVNANKVSGIYTNERFKVKVNCSNVNKTNGSSNVTINLPSGVSYISKESGDGTVTVSGQTLTWKPGLSAKKLNANVVILTSITTNGNHNIQISESTTGHSKTLNINTAEAPVYIDPSTGEEHETDPDTDHGNYNEDTERPQLIVNPIIENEEVEYSLEMDAKTFDDLAHALYEGSILKQLMTYEEYYADYLEYEYLIFAGEFDSSPDTFSKNELIKYKSVGNTWEDDEYKIQVGDLIEADYKLTLTIKGIDIGYDEIYCYARTSSTPAEYLQVATWKILIKPHESDLTIPNFTLLKLSEEECNRLGDGYVYSAQSWLKLITAETYVRDWYKNFRIGVFNNWIEENVTRYFRYDCTDEEFDGYFHIPAEYDISDTYLQIYANQPIEIDDVMVAGQKIYENFTEQNIPAKFGKYSNYDEVTISIALKQNNTSVLLWSTSYKIIFNSDIDDFKEVFDDSTDYDALTDTEIFTNAQYWGKTVFNLNTSESLTTDFVYNEDYPVYLIITGDYPEGDPANNSVDFTEPCVIDADNYNGSEKNGNYLTPILNTIVADDIPAEITITSFEESNHIIIYNLLVDDDFGTTDTLAVRGIEITADIDYTDDLVVNAKLKIPEGNKFDVGSRSIILNSNDDKLSIGGMYDTWGFDISKLVNLKELEVEIGFSNLLETDNAILQLSNFQVIFYVNVIENNPIDTYVNGENVAWYGMYVKNVSVPAGRNTETKYIKVDGTDSNIPSRQNINPKTIKIDFELDGCNLTESTQQLDELAKLFSNNRDELNNAIPNEITFSNYPGKVFEYILEDTFDNEIRISDYKGSINLTIPNGTAFDVEDTVTNVTGFVDSIASVNPIIVLTHITDGHITISELGTEQVLKLNDANLTNMNFETNDIITIDCIERTVSIVKSGDINPIDISESADFNSDWFKIQGEFEFKAENCTIQTVTYNCRS